METVRGSYQLKITGKKLRLIWSVYAVCLHYYSGQWSRGYRLLCIARKQIDRYFPNLDGLTFDKFLRLAEHFPEYKELVRKYGSKL